MKPVKNRKKNKGRGVPSKRACRWRPSSGESGTSPVRTGKYYPLVVFVAFAVSIVATVCVARSILGDQSADARPYSDIDWSDAYTNASTIGVAVSIPKYNNNIANMQQVEEGIATLNGVLVNTSIAERVSLTLGSPNDSIRISGMNASSPVTVGIDVTGPYFAGNPAIGSVGFIVPSEAEFHTESGVESGVDRSICQQRVDGPSIFALDDGRLKSTNGYREYSRPLHVTRFAYEDSGKELIYIECAVRPKVLSVDLSSAAIAGVSVVFSIEDYPLVSGKGQRAALLVGNDDNRAALEMRRHFESDRRTVDGRNGAAAIIPVVRVQGSSSSLDASIYPSSENAGVVELVSLLPDPFARSKGWSLPDGEDRSLRDIMSTSLTDLNQVVQVNIQNKRTSVDGVFDLKWVLVGAVLGVTLMILGELCSECKARLISKSK